MTSLFVHFSHHTKIILSKFFLNLVCDNSSLSRNFIYNQVHESDQFINKSLPPRTPKVPTIRSCIPTFSSSLHL